jgi:hypothetical protein
MKKYIIQSFVAFLVLGLLGCQDKAEPNYQFFPNMYQSAGYETYAESDAFKSKNFIKGQTAQLPVEGTIKQGYVPYEIPNTPEGLELSRTLTSPIDTLSVKDKEKSKELYTIYCAICHGDAGDGKGNLPKREKFLGVPSYKDRPVTKGSAFHVVTYGLNSMGSHASQLSQHERWLVADYVVELKSKL